MATTTPSAALVPGAPVFTGTERLPLAGFLAGYSGLTRQAYELDLRQYASWCQQHHLRLFQARRADIECFARDLEARGRARATITRRVRVLGATEHPVQSWVVQQARNLLMDLEDAGTRAKFVLHDRDASFTAAFDEVFRAAGVRIVRSAVQAPRMNSIMERWISSCRRELLDRALVWNQRHLMTVLREYEDFYNTHRLHRPLSQAAPLRPLPDGITDLDHFRVHRRDRAGGVIHEYRLVA